MLKEELKKRYQSLKIEKKKKVGEALVKVNMGLGTPDEMRLVADFLKGTGIVAKKGAFNSLIVLLNDNPEARKAQALKERTEIDVPVMSDQDFLQNLSFHREDEDETVKVGRDSVDTSK